MCGKPERITYEYSMRLAQQTLPEGLEISEFYMIGDNPNSDIKGAIGMGIKSILVKTGVWQGEGNCAEQPATYVVQDFWDAVQLILTEGGVLEQNP
jgi:ribonucleotide monophosphatase NagD (HAD superfamily)